MTRLLLLAALASCALASLLACPQPANGGFFSSGGSLDELRLSTVARSPDVIELQHAAALGLAYAPAVDELRPF